MEDRARQINEARADEAKLIPQARGEAAETTEQAKGYAAKTTSQARGDGSRFLALLNVFRDWPNVTARRLELETLERVLPKTRKYIKPSASDVGELEIWFVTPSSGLPMFGQQQ